MGLRRESLSPWHFSFRSLERARRGKFNESQGAPRPLPDSFTVMRSGPTSITRPSPGSTILAWGVASPRGVVGESRWAIFVARAISFNASEFLVVWLDLNHRNCNEKTKRNALKSLRSRWRGMLKFRRLPNYRQIPKTVRWFYLRMAGRSGLSDSTELSIPALRLLSRPSVHDGGSLAGKLSARVSSIISSESSLSSE